MKWVARVALLVVATIVSAELFLQVGALLIRDRSGTTSQGEITILCVGDSHTYGGGVEPAKSYPGQLQSELDRVAPGRFKVLNRGIPGFNTTNVRKRLPDIVERHRPDMIWLWVGVNDSWNRSEVDELEQDDGATAPRKSLFERLVDRSRLVKLLRARAYKTTVEQHAQGRATAHAFGPEQIPGGGIRFEMDGVVEQVGVVVIDEEPLDELAKRMQNNYRAIVSYAAERNVPLGFITYPVPYPFANRANTAMQQVAKEEAVVLVDSFDLMSGFPDEERFRTTWGAHPTELHYAEIAKAVAREVLAHFPPFEGQR